VPYYKRKRTSYKRKAYKARLAPVVKRIVNNMEEKKFIQAGATISGNAAAEVRGIINSGTSDVTVNLVGIPQGTGVANRIGLKIRVKEITLSWSIDPVQTNNMSNGGAFRWALVQDNTPNGAMPSFGNIFIGGSQVVWMQEEANRSRFKVLKQGVHNMICTGVNPAGPAVYACGPTTQGQWTIRPNKVVIYSSATNDITALINVNWYLVTQADAANCCVMNLLTKIKYTDA